ncbi:8-oxo-dGTP pyrophosphatase MutT (NUDIX family) [Salirhabdus euzebyi]|uniref:8-oxo-dGTP diphosphatase n=1 Tax=Salirhabdus euzebyi TaxID=394506 RepID=A0A841Q470_9BACI|nr:NUDIX domain-containing protein [Salirhabdus euzebyi]MBB6453209.1 8-oxo-dGTP pyrophosphatase MutT (NUDIX family) [Salirhabdus euzebyi]
MELWDVYDQNRNKTTRVHKRGNPLANGDYHIVVHVWIKNDKGEILLTKRHPSKPHPNLWECPGGSILSGEDSLPGAIREVKEEIGIHLLESNGTLLTSERRDEFNDFYDVWLFNQSFNLEDTILQMDEVSDIKWVTQSELMLIYHANLLVPTLHYFPILFKT